MFAVTAVAFAEEQVGAPESGESNTSRVRFEHEKFKEYVFDKHPSTIEMSTSFMLDGTIKDPFGDGEKEIVWYKDYAVLHAIFPGINYIELKDEDIVSKDDEGFESATKYKLTYKYDKPVAEENPDEANGAAEKEDGTDVEEYQATQHVKLAKSPVAEGYIFVGWTFQFEDDSAVEATEMKTASNYFPAEFQFNMPATNVTVKANWVKKAVDDEKQEDVGKIPELYKNDVVYVLYTSSEPKDDMKDWERCSVEKTFSVTSISWWHFRFAVADGSKVSETDHTFDWDNDVLATSFDNVLTQIKAKEEKGEQFTPAEEKELLKQDYTLVSFSGDITRPIISLSSTMKNKQTEGLTVGTNYSISTALTIEDAGSRTTVTYQVYKWVDGKEVLIYDSAKKTDKVTEGYEENISTSGVITPLEDDVKIDHDYVYRIVYSVVDDYGFFGIENEGDEVEFHPEMKLSVKEAVVEPTPITAVEAWKIVLYVIAGLSAVGIVVLLCIKPKQAVEADGRYTAKAEATEGDAGADDEDEQEPKADEQE